MVVLIISETIVSGRTDWHALKSATAFKSCCLGHRGARKSSPRKMGCLSMWIWAAYRWRSNHHCLIGITNSEFFLFQKLMVGSSESCWEKCGAMILFNSRTLDVYVWLLQLPAHGWSNWRLSIWKEQDTIFWCHKKASLRKVILQRTLITIALNSYFHFSSFCFRLIHNVR